jgi:hypothetical protein
MKTLGIGLIMVLFAATVAFAIQPAQDWTQVATGRYTNSSPADTITTQAGNVTQANIAGNVSTDKWAGFWGNVSGAKVLTQGGLVNIFYQWAWTPASGGRVCLVPSADAFAWATAAAATSSAIDTAWGFNASASDSANQTLNETCSIKLGSSTISGSVGASTGPNLAGDTFQTCAINDGTTSAKGHFAFCVAMQNNGTLFNNATGNYEVIVAANNTAASTETYNAWIELD